MSHPIYCAIERDNQDENGAAQKAWSTVCDGGARACGTRSVAAEAARRIEVGELAEIELDNRLQGLAGRGLAQRFR
jgi:hypothetical protein